MTGPQTTRQMPSTRLDNYLKTYRKRCGLTQSEVAFLLGTKSDAQVSRYEQRRSIPSLRTALACSLILGVAPEQLFAGLQQKAAATVAQQIEKLVPGSENKDQRSDAPEGDQRKLRWLNETKGRIRNLDSSLE